MGEQLDLSRTIAAAADDDAASGEPTAGVSEQQTCRSKQQDDARRKGRGKKSTSVDSAARHVVFSQLSEVRMETSTCRSSRTGDERPSK